jgi:hypothetical protein
MTTNQPHECAICGSRDAQHLVHHPLVLTTDTYACDACFASITTRRPGIPLRQPCAVCGETLHLHSMGTTRDNEHKPVHRECLSAPSPARRLRTVSEAIDSWHDEWNAESAQMEAS